MNRAIWTGIVGLFVAVGIGATANRAAAGNGPSRQRVQSGSQHTSTGGATFQQKSMTTRSFDVKKFQQHSVQFGNGNGISSGTFAQGSASSSFTKKSHATIGNGPFVPKLSGNATSGISAHGSFDVKVKRTFPGGGIQLPTGGATTASGMTSGSQTGRIPPHKIKTLPGFHPKFTSGNSHSKTPQVLTGNTGIVFDPLKHKTTTGGKIVCIPPICPPYKPPYCPPHCPKYCPFPLHGVVVVLPPLVVVPPPIVVQKTVVVGAPVVAKPQGVDLELVAVEFVDAGVLEEQTGPRYRLWFANRGGQDLHREFKVTVLAAPGKEPTADSPHASARIEKIAASETLAVDLRLPGEANEPFDNLFVWIDSAREIKETVETNNATMLARAEVPVAPAPPAEQP